MMDKYTQGWYNWLSWFTDAIGTLAKKASDGCWDKEEAMMECGINSWEPDLDLLVNLFLLEEAMEDEEFKEEMKYLRNHFNDVWEIRHRPELYDGWGIESEEEEE